MRGLRTLPAGTRAVFSSLMTKMSSMWKANPYSSCLLPFSPQLLSLWLSPSSFLCLFLHPGEQWKNQSPVLGCRDAFLPRESQTISTSGPGIFTGGHILGRKKQVSCQLGEWGGEAFLSFLEKLGRHVPAGYFGSSGREYHQTGLCPEDVSPAVTACVCKDLTEHHPAPSPAEGLPRLVPVLPASPMLWVWAMTESQQRQATRFHVGFFPAVS